LGQCPRFITPFPTADFKIPYDFQQAAPRLDAYYSFTAVDEDTHNMLTWSLDQLAKSTQDFFVPTYQNIIDPNLSAILQEQKDKWQWTATNFMVQEERVPRIELVV
jgi:hypothetical protein